MSGRGTETRQRLVDTALRLFRENGFASTTMRRIADEAGVSLGNAHYYFAGKDELVQELYHAVQLDHRDRALPLLAVVLHTGLDAMAPYHSFGTAFVTRALPAGATSSPFSAESGPSRELAVDLMRRAVATSRTRVPRALEEPLPTLLWLVLLGVTLHWVTDASPGQCRTRTLADGVAPIVGKAIGLARLPGAGSLVDDVVGVLR